MDNYRIYYIIFYFFFLFLKYENQKNKAINLKYEYI